jgi:hypothetical protein
MPKHWTTAAEIAAKYRGSRPIRALKTRKPRRCVKRERAIYARIYLPAIPQILGDEEQTRTLNLHLWQDRDFAQDMHENYAAISPHNRPTFFKELL